MWKRRCLVKSVVKNGRCLVSCFVSSTVSQYSVQCSYLMAFRYLFYHLSCAILSKLSLDGTWDCLAAALGEKVVRHSGPKDGVGGCEWISCLTLFLGRSTRESKTGRCGPWAGISLLRLTWVDRAKRGLLSDKAHLFKHSGQIGADCLNEATNCSQWFCHKQCCRSSRRNQCKNLQ